MLFNYSNTLVCVSRKAKVGGTAGLRVVSRHSISENELKYNGKVSYKI